MNVDSIIAFAGTISCMALGVAVLFQNRQKALNRLFFFMSVSLSCVILFANLCYYLNSKEQITLLYKITSFFIPSYLALNVHFNLVLTKRNLTSWKYLILYLPVPIIIITTLTNYSFFSDFVLYQGKWNFVPAYQSFGFYFTFICVFAYTIISLLLIENYRRNAKSNKERRQAVIINSAYLVITILNPFCAFVLPAFDIYEFSAFAPDTFVIYVIAIYYSVFKFRFLDLTPSFMADEIIAHISDMILILNTDLNITMHNELCAEVLDLPVETLNNKSLFEIISREEDLKIQIERLMASKEKSLNCRLSFQNKDGEIFTNAYISKIYDKFDDHTGFLIIAKEIKGKSDFLAKYKITAREFEIVDLVLSGLSNKIIAEKLGISERTVETHRLNVYSKMGIRDRIELFTVAGEFDLIPKSKNFFQ